MPSTKPTDPIRLEDLDSPYVPERPNIFKRFWQTITKTPARRFATAVVAGLLLSALVLGLMFAMPHLMIALTMALGSAAIWMIPTTFAAQIAVFTGVITAAVTLATTFFWGVGELMGLAVAKCRGESEYRTEPYPFASPNSIFAPSAAQTQTTENLHGQANPTPSSDSEREPEVPVDTSPPADAPPVPPAKRVDISTLSIEHPLAPPPEDQSATVADPDNAPSAGTSPSSN